MKESKGFKMLNKGYLSCIGRLNKRLINFHKNILKNYVRPLGANSPGFLESYLGLRMFRYPGLKMLNLSEVEMVYLVQPVINTLYKAYPARYKASRNNLSVFKQTLKLKRDRIHLDSEISSEARTTKSEIFTRREEIFFSCDKFDLNAPKGVIFPDHIPSPVLQENKMADIEFKMQHKKPAFFLGNTVVNDTKADLNKQDRKIATYLTEQRSPSFLQRSIRIYHGRPPEAQPVFYFRRPSLSMHKFIHIRNVNELTSSKRCTVDEVNSSTFLSDTQQNTSFFPRLVFADRHYNSGQSFEVMKVKEDTNSREGVRSYPIGLESSGLTTLAQHSTNHELIADRVYDIIENRLRIEKERE